MSDVIVLDVGGTIFKTKRNTLSGLDYFDDLLLPKNQLYGAYFIDRNPKYFEYILDFLRIGEIIQELSILEYNLLLYEAIYYHLYDLIKYLLRNIFYLQYRIKLYHYIMNANSKQIYKNYDKILLQKLLEIDTEKIKSYIIDHKLEESFINELIGLINAYDKYEYKSNEKYVKFIIEKLLFEHKNCYNIVNGGNMLEFNKENMCEFNKGNIYPKLNSFKNNEYYMTNIFNKFTDIHFHMYGLYEYYTDTIYETLKYQYDDFELLENDDFIRLLNKDVVQVLKLFEETDEYKHIIKKYNDLLIKEFKII